MNSSLSQNKCTGRFVSKSEIWQINCFVQPYYRLLKPCRDFRADRWLNRQKALPVLYPQLDGYRPSHGLQLLTPRLLISLLNTQEGRPHVLKGCILRRKRHMAYPLPPPPPQLNQTRDLQHKEFNHHTILWRGRRAITWFEWRNLCKK